MSSQPIPSIPVDWNDLITVIVGTGSTERKFTAHASVLKRIDFFKGCLSADMKEAKERLVRLPEDNPDMFEDLLHWAYFDGYQCDLEAFAVECRALSSGRSKEDTAKEVYWEEVKKRVRVYAFARKMCAEMASNAAIDTLWKHYDHWTPGAAQLGIALDELDGGDALLRLFKKKTSAQIYGTSGGLKEWMGHDKGWNSDLNDRYDFMKFILEAMAEYPDSDNECWSFSNPCEWHTHVNTPKCASISDKDAGPEAASVG
ncbi:uncharacterized protein AB675_7655 [Cyphellophora attinorum]|uniref:BTB domain-containing protein n=1 Tax=Cyphellophora attinorum TaxID=1664694 RepID=A0A0N1HB96_9EURO|nr:uncharacterized protein AB675_7655 [Phialophora attinorum]KPI40404.1 hypothetical protein AB675_7655 [Phialophora attinorum]